MDIRKRTAEEIIEWLIAAGLLTMVLAILWMVYTSPSSYWFTGDLVP